MTRTIGSSFKTTYQPKNLSPDRTPAKKVRQVLAPEAENDIDYFNQVTAQTMQQSSSKKSGGSGGINMHAYMESVNAPIKQDVYGLNS